MADDQEDHTGHVTKLTRPTFEGVPTSVAESFLRGLDDVIAGRTIAVAAALAEGRRRIAEYRARRNSEASDDPLSQQRE